MSIETKAEFINAEDIIRREKNLRELGIAEMMDMLPEDRREMYMQEIMNEIIWEGLDDDN